MRVCTLSSASGLAVAICVLLSAVAHGDIIHLKNGAKIEGTATHSPDGRVIISIPSVGKITIPGAGIVRIEKGARAANAQESAPTPATGRDDAAQARPAAAAAGSIATTHSVEFKDGRVLRGNLLSAPGAEVVELRIGTLGIMRIDGARVASVQAEAGEIIVPEAPPERPLPEPPQVEPEDTFEQTIAEVADAVIRTRFRDGSGVDLDPALGDLIERYVYELSRQRTTNRVRAEHHLIRLGPDVLPFLDPAAKHPFDLTRRAVQRIIREVGDPEGAPLAIRALNDSDEWVRLLASQALEQIFDAGIRYDARWSEPRRVRVKEAYWKRWVDRERDALRQAVEQVLTTER